ncbi:hypothetical protein [Paraburkholderia sp. GAS348]|uniref:hypothetical protein n=1 Tax=Paraburkholderia sp. GAS348 TaxID=3035132 RepID=UPI003D1ABC0F
MGSLRKVHFLVIAAALSSGAIAVSQERPAGSGPNTEANAAAGAQEMLYYVCGQAGFEKAVTSPDPNHPFNLGVTFVSGQGGAPLSDVSVKLRRHGRVLMDFVASGPRCLFAVPTASYRVEGTYRGEMKFEIVETGTFDTQIKW